MMTHSDLPMGCHNARTGRNRDITMRVVALLLFAVVVFLYSWNSDDAYHSYIMARHLVEGKGLVYNTGYRVSASTCPLLTLIESFVFVFTQSPDLCGLLIGLFFSSAAAWVLFFRICSSPASVFCMLGLMVSSRCFLSFTTSGLENPLLFLLGALFLDVYCRNERLSKFRLLAIAFLMSLLAMARTDSVLIFIPMAVWAFLRRSNVPFPIRAMLGVVGLSPFVLWTVFSVFYYGFPFPNTYYAKLHTGIPLADSIESGLWYYITSWLIDPMLVLVPVLFVAMAVKNRMRCYVPVFIGLATYCLYVVSVGGDFMAGRHLTQQYFLSLCGIAYMLGSVKVDFAARSNQSRFGGTFRSGMAVALLLVLVGVVWNGLVAPIVNTRWATVEVAYSTRRSALDERQLYLSEVKDMPMFMAAWRYLKCGATTGFVDEVRKSRILAAHEEGKAGLCFEDKIMMGRDVFAASDLDMYLTDIVALQDPLLARLKVDISRPWRVGHAQRRIPRGYHETIAKGENMIENPFLHEYFDKLLLVMKAPLLDDSRLKAILEFNCGKYDNLLEEYEKTAHGHEELVFAIRALTEERDGEKALELLDRCLASVDGPILFGPAHFYRGCVFDDLKDDADAAETEYEVALGKNWGADMVSCADRLARIKAIKGCLSEAIELWTKAAELDPCNDSVRHNLEMARKRGKE